MNASAFRRAGRPFAAATLLAATLLAASLLGTAGMARAQGDLFGQNKIQYNVFDWRIFEGEHVLLYHYGQEEELARHALVLAEAAYTDLAVKFRVEAEEKVPLVLYNSHHHFEETNLIPSLLPEGVAGFTEFLRGRVALPFTGSYGELSRVIRHEMVHVFQRAKLSQVYRLHRRNDFASMPLWFTEGLAEYWSNAPEAEAAMVLSDLVLNQQIPPVSDLDLAISSAAIYPIGASLVAHIARRFGEERLLLLFEDLWLEPTFSRVLEAVTGVAESDLTGSWHRELKEHYFPLIAAANDAERDVERLLPVRVPGRMPAVAPPGARAPGGEVVYLSTRLGRISVFALPLAEPEGGDGEATEPREVLRGETEERFESLHPGSSRIDVSSDRRAALVSKYQDRDAIHFLDLDEGGVEGPFHFETLIALFSPSWSPDGTRLVFSALSTEGMSDLYLFTPANGRLERLTHDRNLDADPDWSPDGRSIVFSSDRGTTGEHGFENLWLFDLETYELSQLTSGRWNDRSPRWSPGGDRVLCTSDRGGIGNPWLVDRSGYAEPAASYLTGCLEADWLPGGDGIVFAAYRDGTFGIFRQDFGDSSDADAPAPGTVDASPTTAELSQQASTSQATLRWSWPALPEPAPPLTPYRPEYHLDVAQGAVSYSLGGNFDEALQAVLSDAMNDRLLLFSLTYTGSSIDEIFSRISAGIFYVNLAHRMHYGYGAFHYVGDYVDNRGDPFFERRVGVNLLAAYPFSRFHRVETGLLLAHSEKSQFPEVEHRRRPIGQSYVAWVRDASVWGSTGPVEGDRERIAVSSTMDLQHARSENIAVIADVRRYIHLGGPLTYAGRLFGAVSSGIDPEIFLLGGSWNLRGYRWNSFVGTRAFLLSQELRFPLLSSTPLFSSRTFGIPPIHGALFVDGGNAWDEHEEIRSLAGSYGFGLRMGLGGFTVLRLDVSWLTDFHRVYDGARTDLFIGWNF